MYSQVHMQAALLHQGSSVAMLSKVQTDKHRRQRWQAQQSTSLTF
jgi:hypothetical protein